jgi:N-acetylmuramoyl-L-alanine amidase
MATSHTIVQGECLSSIAEKYGFASWRAIYDHFSNADFRKARPNPNIVYPGDVVSIPDKQVKSVKLATGAAHVLRIKREPCHLRIIVRDEEGQVLAGKKFQLTVKGQIQEGMTSDKGLIEKPVPAGAEQGELAVWADGEARPPDEWTVNLGHLDPINTLSGIQARLNNLGYECGEVDGIDGPDTQQAVRAFQADHHELTVDGIAGPKTQASLKREYGI